LASALGYDDDGFEEDVVVDEDLPTGAGAGPDRSCLPEHPPHC